MKKDAAPEPDTCTEPSARYTGPRPMSHSSEPKYVYRIVPPSAYRAQEIATEAEAESLLGSLRDRHYARYRDAQVERFEKVGRGERTWRKRDGHWLNTAYIRAERTTEEILALEEEEANRPRPVGPRRFVGTFTRDHYHPNTGQNLRFARIEFQAMSHDDANDLMWDAFGDGGWWDAHCMDDIAPEDQESLLAPPYFRIPWPTPPVVGETVTLRVRITPSQSRESSLWVAGRCLLHRSVARNMDVSFGAGVETEVAEDRQIFRMRGASPIGGAGVVLRVRFFRREDAERAVAADPENVSIVEGSVTHGAFRMPRKVHADEPEVSKNKILISGTFTANELCEIAGLVRSFSPVYRQVDEELERLGVAEEAVLGIEIEENRVVAIHVKAERGY
jgi:hypothetical protein